jgi:hypothetical protein
MRFLGDLEAHYSPERAENSLREPEMEKIISDQNRGNGLIFSSRYGAHLEIPVQYGYVARKVTR